MAMGKGPKCNAATQTFIMYVILTFIYHTDCSGTERITCEPELCQHGICYRTTKSITVGGDKDMDIMQCPDGFDKHQSFCFRLDLVKQSWLNANEYSVETGILATLFAKEDVDTAAEYLRSKLSDDHAPVWANLIFEQVSSTVPDKPPQCTVLEPANYTRWNTSDCESELYSLRTDTLPNPTPTYDTLCRCHPGYTGVTCDIIDSEFNSQEQINPDALQCPGNTVIFVEFALDGYEANDVTGTDRFATSTLAILRSVCQGKNNCNLQPFKTETVFYDKPPNATLVVRHSCVNASDMYCYSNGFQKVDDKSVKCVLPMYRNVPWHAVYYYCFQNGGHLAEFNSGIECVNSSGIASVLNSSTPFWPYDDLPDDGGQDDRAMSISIIAGTKECSQELPGICVIPPFYQGYYEIYPTNTLAQVSAEAEPEAEPEPEAEVDPLYSLVLLPIAAAIAGIVKYYRSRQDFDIIPDF